MSGTRDDETKKHTKMTAAVVGKEKNATYKVGERRSHYWSTAGRHDGFPFLLTLPKTRT